MDSYGLVKKIGNTQYCLIEKSFTKYHGNLLQIVKFRMIRA